MLSMENKILKSIEDGDYSLVITRNGRVVFTSKEKGLGGLIFAAKNNLLKGSLVFDKTIGLAAAKICCWIGARKIFCLVASRKAIAFLKRRKPKIETQKIIKEILDENGRKCSMERIAEKTKNFNQFLENIGRLKNDSRSVKLERASKDGVFPDDYYTTTSLRTWIKIKDEWLEVKHPEMDKGIRVSEDRKSAETVWGGIVKQGDLIVAGQEGEGLKIEKSSPSYLKNNFGFMQNETSPERSKEVAIRKVVKEMKKIKKRKGRILFVVGPAVIHVGAGKYLAKLVSNGFVNLLFSGNALAAHDLEENILGTSLGFDFKKGVSIHRGYHHHLWAINLAKKHGSIKKTVIAGILKSGIMHECIRKNVDFVLCGSIRDDGPLPEVITDTQKAQEMMRSKIRKGVDLAIMVATTLHSVAVGNLLPAEVKKIIVDINPSVTVKLSDRGTNAFGIVTDGELFFQRLCHHLGL